jgi:hypothetical protein
MDDALSGEMAAQSDPTSVSSAEIRFVRSVRRCESESRLSLVMVFSPENRKFTPFILFDEDELACIRRRAQLSGEIGDLIQISFQARGGDSPQT